MNDQAQYEELLALGKSILQMVGESHRIGRENQKLLRLLDRRREEEEEATDPPPRVGEPFTPDDLPPDD